MKKRLISLLITAFLIFSLLFIWYMINTKYFLGSYYKNRYEDSKIVEQMMNKLLIKNYEFINTHSMEELVYIVEVMENDAENIVWFNKDLMLLARKPLSSYNEKMILSKATELNVADAEIKLGFYNNNPVIVLVTKQNEIILNYDTLEVVLIFNKKVV